MSPPKLTRTGSLMDPQGVRPAGTNTAGTEPQRMGARRRLEFGQSPGANSSTAGEGNNSKKKKQLPTVSEVAELASKEIPAFDPLQIPHRLKRKTPIPTTKKRQPTVSTSTIELLSAAANVQASKRYQGKLREAIDEVKKVTEQFIGKEKQKFNEKIKKLEQESKSLMNQKLALEKKRANEALASERKRVNDELQKLRKEAKETLILAEKALQQRYENGSPRGRQGITQPTIENHSRTLAERRNQEKGGRGGNGGGSMGGRGGNGGGRRKGLLTPKRLTFNNVNEKIKTSKKRTELERKLELKNYITKKDFNKLVEKLDKPRTPSKEQLTKNNVAEMLKPLLNKKEKQPKFSLFGALGDINKKKLASRKPESIARAVASKFRKEIVEKLKPRTPRVSHSKTRPSTPRMYTRTPTTGQRKKHVIELIDRVLRRMKVRKDVEKKLIKFYESLSERHIKQLFGGRTKEEVKTILKKQVDYFSKKR